MPSEYPSDWDTRRKRVYRRDNYRCQNCSRKGGHNGDVELHAHHVVPKAKGGTHELSNLKTLCSECHNAIHGNTIAPTGRSTPTSSETQDVEITSAGPAILKIILFLFAIWLFVGFGFETAFLILGVPFFFLAMGFLIWDTYT